MIDCLERKEDYSLWLIIGAIEASLVFKEKELLPHFLEFDKLLQTLMTSYERDLDNLIEIVCDEDALDLLEWGQCVKCIGEEWCIKKPGLDTTSAGRKGKHFLFIIAILCK